MTEPTSIHLQIDADVRLAAAAGGAARYFGDMAGLDGPALVRLQDAVIYACKQVFTRLTRERPWLEVTLTRLVDRIEVALTNQAQWSVTEADKKNAGTSLAGVDSVQYENHGQVAIMRLTKYIIPTAPEQ